MVHPAKQQEKLCYANIITKLHHSYQAWHYYLLEKTEYYRFSKLKRKDFIFHCNASKQHPNAVQ